MPIHVSDIPTPSAPVCLTSRSVWNRRQRAVWALKGPDLDGIRPRLDFERLAGLTQVEAFEEHLIQVLNSGARVFFEDGEPRIVEGPAPAHPLPGLRLVIGFDAHGTSRFHVLGAGADASFAVADGVLLAGGSDRRQTDLIRYWYLHAKPHLIKAWNDSRSFGPSV